MCTTSRTLPHFKCISGGLDGTKIFTGYIARRISIRCLGIRAACNSKCAVRSASAKSTIGDRKSYAGRNGRKGILGGGCAGRGQASHAVRGRKGNDRAGPCCRRIDGQRGLSARRQRPIRCPCREETNGAIAVIHEGRISVWSEKRRERQSETEIRFRFRLPLILNSSLSVFTLCSSSKTLKK